jgi:uncharacterized membrane protein
MKNNNLTEPKPSYIYEAGYSSDNEISLVDLAMVLVRRKRMLALITTFIIALGLVVALLAPKSYTFSTSIEIGSQIINGAIKPFESPETLLAKIQYAFIPQTLNEQQQTIPEDETKYKITARIPKNSVIIVLEIKGTEDKADLLKSLLQSITQQAIFDHSRIYDTVRKNIASRLKQTTTELEILKKTSDNETDVVTQQNLIEVYSSQLANLRETREILPAMKSIEPTGTSKKLIVIVAAFAGVFLGVFSAFFAEFIAKVREASKQ